MSFLSSLGPMCSHGTPLYNQFLLKCQQVTFPMREMSEDCLNLDVYTPSLRGKRPVLFWIHGGGYFSGIDLCYLALTHPHIYIHIGVHEIHTNI